MENPRALMELPFMMFPTSKYGWVLVLIFFSRSFSVLRERLGSDCFEQIQAMVDGVANLLVEVTENRYYVRVCEMFCLPFATLKNVFEIARACVFGMTLLSK